MIIALLLLLAVLGAGVTQHAVTETPAAQPVATATPAPTDYNRLKVGTDLTLPANITTVHQAAQYLLAPVGYNLVIPRDGFDDNRRLLARSPSRRARVAGYTTIENALLLLAGDDVRVLVDHTNKLVAFELLD